MKLDHIHYRLFLISLILSFYGCHSARYSKSSCDNIDFHENNTLNDAGKLVFEHRVVFDTTANQLSGHLIDSVTGQPIANAWVIITKDSTAFKSLTNDKGAFDFFKDGFFGKWRMLVKDDRYRCMQINSIDIGGGLDITIKLSPDSK